MKVCSKCKRYLPSTPEYFHRDKSKKDGLYSSCKNCHKEYYQANREEIIKQQKEYDKTHREERNQKKKQYYKAHKEEHNKYMKQYYKEKEKKHRKERYKRDPKFRLHQIFSTAIYQALKRKGSSKNGYSWEKIVGYTTQDLMEHLERQFRNGMSWDNYGEWHIDHIKPISAFDFTSYQDNEFQECWALKNLQPLWAEQNRKKKAKLLLKIGFDKN